MALAQQLGQLKQTQEKIIQGSILYAQATSAAQDVDTIYYAGNKAMNKLICVDVKFTDFQKQLFSVERKGCTRQLMKKSDSEELNNTLRKCLLLLSQYFSYEPTQQVIEYFLRNFQIHEYLADECVVYFMQYHSTTIYTRLLQNLVDQHRSDIWGFLYEPISRASTVRREQLIRQMQLDYRILKQLLEYSYQCLVVNDEPTDIVVNVNDGVTLEEIRMIKLRQPQQLSFVFAILYELRVSNTYFEQVRASLGRVIAQCLELKSQECLSFVYMVFQQQLFDSQRVWLSEHQVINTAVHIYGRINDYTELALLFYQFGIHTIGQASLQLLQHDLSRHYGNALLFLEIIKPLEGINIPEVELNEAMNFVKHILSREYCSYFLENLVKHMHHQLIDVVRPYLKETEFSELFPQSLSYVVTVDNVSDVLQQKHTFSRMSVGSMKNLIDDSYKLYLQSKNNDFIQILNAVLVAARKSYSQAQLMSQDMMYKLFSHSTDSLVTIVKYVLRMANSDKLLALLLYAVHHDVAQINGFLNAEQFGFQITTKQQLYIKLSDQLDQFISLKSYDTLIKQAQITIAVNLDRVDLIQKFIDAYTDDDTFVVSMLKMLDQQVLLNLHNPFSVRVLKQQTVNVKLFYTANEVGRLKVLLSQEYCAFNKNFLTQLFLIYDTLSQMEKSVFIQLATKFKDQLLRDTQLQVTLGQLLKNKKELNFTRTLGNLTEQSTYIQMHIQYMNNHPHNEIIIQQFQCLAKILSNKSKQEDIQLLLNIITKQYNNDLLDAYFVVQSFLNNKEYAFLRLMIPKLPIELADIVNKYIPSTDIPSDVKTSMIIFVYQSGIQNKQTIKDSALDYNKLIKLLEDPRLSTVVSVIELLKVNLNDLHVDVVKQLFKLNCSFVYQLCTLIYEYMDINDSHLLTECGSLLDTYMNKHQPNLHDINHYLAVSSIVSLLAKHVQRKSMSAAYKLTCHKFINDSDNQNQLLYTRIIITQFLNHNKQYFNAQLCAPLIVKSIQLTSDLTNEILPHFSMFSIDQWWIIAYCISAMQLPAEYVRVLRDFMESQQPTIKLQWVTTLCESMQLKVQQATKQLKTAPSKPDKTKFITPMLESTVNKCANAMKDALLYKPKQQLAQILAISDSLLVQIKRYLLSAKLTALESTQLKTCIISLHKVAKLMKKSKLGTLALKLREHIVGSMHTETMITLISDCLQVRGVSKILCNAFNDLLQKDVIKITRAQHPLLLSLVEQITQYIDINISVEVLVTLSYIFNMQPIVKQIMQQQDTQQLLFTKLYDVMHQLSIDKQSLILNLFSLAALQNNYPFIQSLNAIMELLIQLYASQLEDGSDTIASKLSNIIKPSTQVISMDSKLVLQEAIKNSVNAFRGLISKQQVQQLILLCLVDQNQEGIQCILELIEKRILLDHIPKVMEYSIAMNVKTVQQFTQFTGKLISSCEQEQVQACYMLLSKQLLNVFDYAREQFIDNEAKGGVYLADDLEEDVITSLLEIVLKINDIQLKKLYNSLITWSKQPITTGYNYNKYRKITFFKLSNRISEKLKQYFTKYYTYIFDAILNELQTYQQMFYETPKQTKLSKRTSDECDMFYKLELVLCRHVMMALRELCQHDKDEFLDTEKFEKLCEPLAGTLDCARVQQFEPLLSFIDEWIAPTILSVFNAINDDYKWKTLHHQILLIVSRHANKKNETSAIICIAIVRLLQQLIDQLDDRYLVLMNDLIPFLHTLTFSQSGSEELETRVKQLIVRLSSMSGEDITSIMK